jgi:hypothetical protein
MGISFAATVIDAPLQVFLSGGGTVGGELELAADGVVGGIGLCGQCEHRDRWRDRWNSGSESRFPGGRGRA